MFFCKKANGKPFVLVNLSPPPFSVPGLEHCLSPVPELEPATVPVSAAAAANLESVHS